MNINQNGTVSYTTDELVNVLYVNPDVNLTRFFVEDPAKYNDAIKTLYADLIPLKLYNLGSMNVEEIDEYNQSKWFMPDEYKNLDIAEWVLAQCKTEEELQRVGTELLLYNVRDMFDLLRWLKYFVDTMRKHNIVWGVGRGSSVSSYVLYLIGVHKINSIYYDLNINEFLK